MTPTISQDKQALNRADRCDRCGAQAYVRAVMPGGGELLFCAHHGRRYAPRLREVAVELHDHEGVLETATGS